MGSFLKSSNPKAGLLYILGPDCLVLSSHYKGNNLKDAEDTHPIPSGVKSFYSSEASHLGMLHRYASLFHSRITDIKSNFDEKPPPSDEQLKSKKHESSVEIEIQDKSHAHQPYFQVYNQYHQYDRMNLQCYNRPFGKEVLFSEDSVNFPATGKNNYISNNSRDNNGNILNQNRFSRIFFSSNLSSSNADDMQDCLYRSLSPKIKTRSSSPESPITLNKDALFAKGIDSRCAHIAKLNKLSSSSVLEIKIITNHRTLHSKAFCFDPSSTVATKVENESLTQTRMKSHITKLECDSSASIGPALSENHIPAADSYFSRNHMFYIAWCEPRC